jgi:predicted dehydrogenase
LSEHARPDGGKPVPVEFSGEMFFDGGVSATFYCSFVTELEERAVVSGTRGYLQVGDFVVPNSGSEIAFETGTAGLIFEGCDTIVEAKTKKWVVAEASHGHASAQETKLFRNFAALVGTGKLSDFWPEVSLKTQQVMEACMQSARAGGWVVELGRG